MDAKRKSTTTVSSTADKNAAKMSESVGNDLKNKVK